jgi:cob(I)alamin adenosyltransferase
MSADREERHRLRMQRKKAAVDAAIARGEQDKGLLLVLTGNGKGKSISAFGMVARALGDGLRSALPSSSRGARIPAKRLLSVSQPGVAWHVFGEGFTWAFVISNADQLTQGILGDIFAHAREGSLGLIVVAEH